MRCLLIRGGRVAAVGSEEEIRSLAREAEWLDLDSAVVVPGLTDSHIHLLQWASGIDRPDLTGMTSAEKVVDRVAEVAASSPRTAWLEFSGWDPGLRTEGCLASLEAAAGGRAVSLVAHDLHSEWFSSKAMSRLGIDGSTQDPPGGRIEPARVGDHGRPATRSRRALSGHYPCGGGGALHYHPRHR